MKRHTQRDKGAHNRNEDEEEEGEGQGQGNEDEVGRPQLIISQLVVPTSEPTKRHKVHTIHEVKEYMIRDEGLFGLGARAERDQSSIDDDN